METKHQLERIVEEEKPKIPVRIILESEAWQHHQETCENPQLIIPSHSQEQEEKNRLEKEIQQQREAEEKERSLRIPEQKQESLMQQQPPFSRGSSKDQQQYLSAEAFQAGCQCGAQFSIQGKDVQQIASPTSSYSAKKTSESSYGKHVSAETASYSRSSGEQKKEYV